MVKVCFWGCPTWWWCQFRMKMMARCPDYQCESTIKLKIGKGMDAWHDGDVYFAGKSCQGTCGLG